MNIILGVKLRVIGSTPKSGEMYASKNLKRMEMNPLSLIFSGVWSRTVNPKKSALFGHPTAVLKELKFTNGGIL